MQVYPLGLFAFISELPESPHWFLVHGKDDKAKASLKSILGEEDAKQKHEEMVKAQEEETDENVGYM
jgi:hypothetical protein